MSSRHTPVSPTQSRTLARTAAVVLRALAGLAPLALPAVAAVGALALTSPAAFAQVRAAEPYYAVVTADRATVRCGYNDRYYKVLDLNKDQIVLVDGEADGWARIAYPAGSSAFVRAEDARLDGQSLRLSAPSKLRAPNATSGFSGSWKSLFDVALPTDTALTLVESVKEANGAVVAYRVNMPEGARGFVEARSLRRAAEAEVQAARAKGATLRPLAGTPVETAQPAAQPPNAQPPAVQLPTGQTDAATPPATTPPATNATANTTTPPVTNPVTSADGQPTAPTTPPTTLPADGAAPQPTDAVVVPVPATNEGNPGEVPANPAERRVGTIEQLETTFRQVWSQPVLDGEIDTLRAEYERAVEAEPAGSPRRRALQQRVDAIQLRVESRDRLRRLEDARAALDNNKVRIAEQLRALELTRVYTIVGQLQPSTVYDGTRLPLMYRVVSVAATAPRTLGYLKSTPELDLNAMLGKVVGVIGESTLDRSLQLNIITPVRVDVLRSTGEAPAAAPAPAPAAEPAPE